MFTLLADKSAYLQSDKLFQIKNQQKNHTNQLLQKFRKCTLYSSFKDNNWGADLADMQLINKFNKGFQFLLCVINICSKYTWVVPLQDKKGIKITNTFQQILHKSGRK